VVEDVVDQLEVDRIATGLAELGEGQGEVEGRMQEGPTRDGQAAAADGVGAGAVAHVDRAVAGAMHTIAPNQIVFIDGER